MPPRIDDATRAKVLQAIKAEKLSRNTIAREYGVSVSTVTNIATIFGRTVHLVGAADVRAEGRIRGATAALIYIDEATLVPESFFTMCLSRIRVPGARLICTTNPDGPSHWLRKSSCSARAS
ncbi:phage terminase large subunit [Spirillospora sp. CA-128828]|uniref:phage terminase large subunit n=1 Tax=Spirillospora sp. CA-128828 TaxID=3240033 RepID=UPI003D8BC304